MEKKITAIYTQSQLDIQYRWDQYMERIKPEADRLKAEYPAGTRVELVRMEDEYSRLKPGDKGTVTGVDDIGTIHVNWDCGSGLGIAYGEDSCRKIGV